MKRFEQKVVFISGAAGEIGKMLVKRYAEEGAILALADLNKDALELDVTELNLPEDRYLLIHANATDEEQVKQYVQRILETYQRIDVYVHAIGTRGPVGNVVDLDFHDVDFLWKTLIRSAFLNMKHMIPVMQEQKSGVILTISTVLGLAGLPSMSAYSMVEHALLGLTKTAALECAEINVRCNTICAGPLDSRWMKEIESQYGPDFEKMIHETFLQSIPMIRFGTLEEVADFCLFLSSDQAKYITGGHFYFDGGLMATRV
jgi:meso-butanediol dehydrogenase / (S,S)-butanediol dehydrogenase / diacetyl reductase